MRIITLRLLLPALALLIATPAAADATALDELAREAQRLSWAQRYDEAVDIYEEVLARDPRHPLAGPERAKVLSWARRYEEAIAAFRALLADDPGNPEARIGLARVLSWSGDNRAAREEYEKVLAAQPGDPDALLGIAQTWAWSGELARARQAYETAARAGGDPAAAQTGLAYLDLWEGATGSARRRAEDLGRRYPESGDVAELLQAVRRETAPRVTASWDQIDDTDHNLFTTQRIEASTTLRHGAALRVSYADYDVRTLGRGGSIRSLQGGVGWSPAPGHSLEAMLGLDRLQSPDLEDHDVVDWGLRWNLRLPAAWRGTLDARREPFRYSVPLIDNRIVTESITLVAEGPLDDRWRLATSLSGWRLSDDNTRLAAELGLRRQHQAGEHRLEGGLNVRLQDWQHDLDNGYFDPSEFRAWGVTARAFGPLAGSGALDYDVSAEFGLQSFDNGGLRTRNDRYYLLVGRLGWQATTGLRVELYADGGSYASQGGADWRYTRVGARFQYRFGAGVD